MNTKNTHSFKEGDLVYDETWDSYSEVLQVEGDEVVLLPETWLGQDNQMNQTTHHTADELKDASHLIHYPQDTIAYVGLELVEEVKGVGDSVIDNLEEEFTYEEFKAGCQEAYHYNNTEILEKAKGVGPALAERIATHVIENDR